MVGDEANWVAIALGGFVTATLAFGVAVVVAARRGLLERLTSGVALGVAGFIGAIVLAFVTNRPPAGGPRLGEPILPLTWGIAWGFYAFAVLLLAVVLSKRPPPKG